MHILCPREEQAMDKAEILRIERINVKDVGGDKHVPKDKDVADDKGVPKDKDVANDKDVPKTKTSYSVKTS